MKTNQAIKVIDSLREATKNGARFMSFLYTTKGTQETSLYTINFGIDYRASVEHDKLALESYQPKNDLEVQGKAEMLKSLTETLTEGVSQAYTNVDTYESIGKGIKIHKETDELYIYGYVQSKTVIAEAQNPKKPVNSKPITLAKKGIEKACGFKRVKFSQYILNPEHIAGIKVNGDTIEVQS
jgi:ribosomal protein L9